MDQWECGQREATAIYLKEKYFAQGLSKQKIFYRIGTHIVKIIYSKIKTKVNRATNNRPPPQTNKNKTELKQI
jgi:hypothetical protein